MTSSDRSLFYSVELEQSLREFAAASVKQLTPQLEQIVQSVASTGLLCYPWNHLKILILCRLKEIIATYEIQMQSTNTVENTSGNQQVANLQTKNAFTIEQLRAIADSIAQQLESSQGAPFTLQRLCELILNPFPIYKNPKKYLFAVEKILSVSSTISQLNPREYDQSVAALISQKNSVISNSTFTNAGNGKVPELANFQIDSSTSSNFSPFTNSTQQGVSLFPTSPQPDYSQRSQFDIGATPIPMDMETELTH